MQDLIFRSAFHGEHSVGYNERMGSVAENLKRLMDLRGIKQSDLAAATGANQPTLSKILRGEILDPGSKVLAPLARYFGKAVAQLRGEIPLEIDGVVEPDEPMTRLPLISWVMAGVGGEACNPYAPGVAESWEPFDGKYPAEAYCLRVKGDSMEPDFPAGSIIAIDPNLEARNGSFVVVRFSNSDEATFKQLVIDGPFKFLKPLNSRYNASPVPADAQLCGVVTEVTLKRKFR